jgi:hypothetical protein
MLRAPALVVGGLLMATIALAAADIPTRYVGAFPSVGNITSITGTFTGTALSLSYTVARPGGYYPTTANYSCARAAPNKTSCTGQFQASDGFRGRTSVQITWKSGLPIAMQFGKKH